MLGIAAHLVRRAMDPELTAAIMDIQDFKPSPGATVTLAITFVIFCMMTVVIDYFYREVILAVAVVETPHDKMYLAVEPPRKTDSAIPLLVDADNKMEDSVSENPQSEMLLLKRPLVMSSLRKASRHLKAQVGRFVALRGLGLWMVYHTLFALCRGAVNRGIFASRCATFSPLASFVAAMLMTPFMMTWTHLVISKPSTKWWMSRMPSFWSILKVAPATAVWALAEQLAIGLPLVLANMFGLFQLMGPSESGVLGSEDGAAAVVALKMLVVGVVAMATYLLILIPARVTLTRVQASMLPEADEAVVPFDRTFDGKVVAEADGGNGKLGLLDAWRTFSWVSRRNLLKLIFQTIVLEMCLGIFFGILFAVQIRIFLGKTYDSFAVVGNYYLYGNS